MDRDELMRMLDIKPTKPEAGKPITGVDKATGPDRTVTMNVSPYALQLDEWDIDQGRRCLAESHIMSYTGMTEAEAADFYAVYFQQEPAPNEAGTICASPQRAEFIQTLLDTPDYQVLHQRTCANPYEALIAAGALAEAWAKIAPPDKGDGQHPSDTEAGKGGEADGIAKLLAASHAVKQASDEIEELDELQMALGCGKQAATNERMDMGSIKRSFAQARNNAQLRRIIQLAGRYRRSAQSKQRAKATHGYDDMVGVEMDGDVGRLLPVERVMLADNDFELDAMRRLVERQSACRRFEGVESKAKGPIVVVVDESGSMRGDKIAQAKAFALAMAWVARHQHRYCAFVSFSSEREGTRCVLPPGRWDERALLNWLGGMMGGGTELTVPLQTLPFKYWDEIKAPKGKTDMILITDGIVHAPPAMQEKFNAWKVAEKVKCHTLIIDEMHAGSLAEVSDEIHFVREFGLNDAGVSGCLGI